MIEVQTFSFRLGVEQNNSKNSLCLGKYFLVLSCDSPFDVNKSFSEEFLTDSELAPFYTPNDIAKFAEEMAAFWKIRLLINPKLDITRLEEMADIWHKLSEALQKNTVTKEAA